MTIQTPPLPAFQIALQSRLHPPWLLQHRTGSGLFIVSQAGTLLLRLDAVSGTLFAWDKKVGQEIPIRLADLTGLLPSAQI